MIVETAMNTPRGWGRDWQTPLWTLYAGTAAWLMWDRLDAERAKTVSLLQIDTQSYDSSTVAFNATLERYPDWVCDAVVHNPEWVEARLAKNPQWINEQIKRMAVQGDLFT